MVIKQAGGNGKQKFDGEEDTLLFCVKREAENLRLSP